MRVIERINGFLSYKTKVFISMFLLVGIPNLLLFLLLPKLSVDPESLPKTSKTIISTSEPFIYYTFLSYCISGILILPSIFLSRFIPQKNIDFFVKIMLLCLLISPFIIATGFSFQYTNVHHSTIGLNSNFEGDLKVEQHNLILRSNARQSSETIKIINEESKTVSKELYTKQELEEGINIVSELEDQWRKSEVFKIIFMDRENQSATIRIKHRRTAIQKKPY